MTKQIEKFYTRHAPKNHGAFAHGSDEPLTGSFETEIALVRDLKKMGIDLKDYKGRSLLGENLLLNVIVWTRK